MSSNKGLRAVHSTVERQPGTLVSEQRGGAAEQRQSPPGWPGVISGAVSTATPAASANIQAPLSFQLKHPLRNMCWCSHYGKQYGVSSKN